MKSFADLNLSPELMKAVTESGYDTPTDIQAQALPILLGDATDFLGLAATGTGKTAAFSIPLLEKVDPKLRTVQGLILCPTRELALQVAGQIEKLGKYKGIRAVAVYGGASYTDQLHGLKNGASIVVGTPGRVVDHLNRGSLKLNDLKTLILDEADEMISMGFKEELERILEQVPSGKSHIWLFSATMDKQTGRMANEYLRQPQQVQINKKEMLSSKIEQIYYPVRESDKPEILCKLIEAADDFYGLIFCQTKQLVTDLNSYLVERGYKVDCLHGDKDQNARERTMQLFRDRKVKILVCTDVASRGLDVKDITHVINYSLPRELDNYVHRIGRTARSGKTGIAMNLVTPSHRRLIFQIEKLTNSAMREGKIPSRKEIGSKKIAKMLPKFSEQETFARAQEIMGDDWKTAIEGMSTEEVAARFITMLMPDLFNDRAIKAEAADAARERDNSYGSRDRARTSYGSRDDRGGGYKARSAAPRGEWQRRDRPAREGGERPYAPRTQSRPWSAKPAGESKPWMEKRERPWAKKEEGGEERPRREFKPRASGDDRGEFKPPFKRGAAEGKGLKDRFERARKRD
ncbi:MAG: DEAD/DEAH box helicase [Bdellovibrionaceae bacterium]|nr:DEAD/DEAH box helicase [Pseudobdellovibrionaceae bacterium]